MTKDEIRQLLSPTFDAEFEDVAPPTQDDWLKLKQRFNTDFSAEFVAFIELMSEFRFPGDIYNVQESGSTNGNDSMILVFEHESDFQSWDPDLIPFYGIGNVDYYCLSAREAKQSKVYYRSHEDDSTAVVTSSFAEWIKTLPDFLG